jgi:small subunit ribosomal protein S16
MAAEGAESMRLDQDRISYWTSNGAQLSDTVARLVKQSKSATA